MFVLTSAETKEEPHSFYRELNEPLQPYLHSEDLESSEILSKIISPRLDSMHQLNLDVAPSDIIVATDIPDATPALLSLVTQVNEALKKEVDRRQEQIQSLYDQISTLWLRMEHNPDESEAFVSANLGCSQQTITAVSIASRAHAGLTRHSIS